MALAEYASEADFEVVGRPDNFKPYDHQKAAWNALDRHYQQKKFPAGVLVVPTGGGKTAIASRWLLEKHIAGGGRVLWLTHRRNLLVQAYHAFAKSAHRALPKDRLRMITISSQDRGWSNVSPDHDVVFSTVQTASMPDKESFLDLFVRQSPHGLFVVVDEAHHAASRSYLRILKKLKDRGCSIFGLTATPVRVNEEDERRMWKMFEKIIYQIDKQVLFENGILARPHVETVQTKIEFERDFSKEDLAHLERYGELAPRVLKRIATHSGRNKWIVDHYIKNRQKYGKTIVFAVDTLHAQTLSQEFNEKGIPADYVDYSRKDAASVMDRYRDQPQPDVIVNVEMLTEGFDAPKTQTVFIARPTQSEALVSQMVGRALRGLKAEGTANAYLVTFVDTWKQFHVVDTEFVVRAGDVGEPEVLEKVPYKLVLIAAELVNEAYKLVKSNVRGDFAGLYECLPHSWYVWETEYEDDIQRHFVLVFENQVGGFEQLLDAHPVEKIPAQIGEAFAASLVQRFFGDCQDPLPRWQDLKALLDARRAGTHIDRYTFEEKDSFSPAKLAAGIRERNLGEVAKEAELKALFEGNPTCKVTYRNDLRAFFEDVDLELARLRDTAPPAPPKVLAAVAKELREWPLGERGYELAPTLDTVAAQKKHFPGGRPTVRSISYTERPLRTYWGCYRHSDGTININCRLNSPDVPRFVLEFLVYHECLHADMPHAAHNRDFRERERRFIPSEQARADAQKRGITAGESPDAWRVLADQFLDTFERHYGSPDGRRMSL